MYHIRSELADNPVGATSSSRVEGGVEGEMGAHAMNHETVILHHRLALPGGRIRLHGQDMDLMAGSHLGVCQVADLRLDAANPRRIAVGDMKHPHVGRINMTGKGWYPVFP